MGTQRHYKLLKLAAAMTLQPSMALTQILKFRGQNLIFVGMVVANLLWKKSKALYLRTTLVQLENITVCILESITSGRESIPYF